jgi:hypothetical protein
MAKAARISNVAIVLCATGKSSEVAAQWLGRNLITLHPHCEKSMSCSARARASAAAASLGVVQAVNQDWPQLACSGQMQDPGRGNLDDLTGWCIFHWEDDVVRVDCNPYSRGRASFWLTVA